jgi:hypothetical protein
MPDTTITAPPFVFKKPAIKLGTTGSSVDIACAANQLVVEADQDENTIETFCGTYQSYKNPLWTITVTSLSSFGTGGLWNALQPLAGTLQAFEILPDGAKVVGPDNPAMRGTCYVKWPAFLNGTVGEASEFDLELGVQGTPTFSTVAALAAESGEPAEQQPASTSA